MYITNYDMNNPGQSKAEVGNIKLTMDEINNLSSIGVGLGLMEKYGLCTLGMERLQDVKDNLLEYYYSREEDVPSLRTFQKNLQHVVSEHNEKSQAFEEILRNIEGKLRGIDEQIVSHLTREGLIRKDLVTDICDMTHEQRNDEYTIIVAGGDSSERALLINYLLGYNVVPTHHTTELQPDTVYTLRFGTEIKVRVKGNDGNWKEKPIDKQASASDISDFVFNHETSSIGTTLREVEIFVPAIILQCGIRIVGLPDSKSDQQHSQTQEFLRDFSSGDILSLLYIIDAADADTFQNEKVQQVLEMLPCKPNRTGFTSFCQPSIMCICCYSEKQSDDELDDIKNALFTNLSKCLPYLQKCDVDTLSMADSKRDNLQIRNYVYTGKDFKSVIDCIQKHFRDHLQSRMKYSYRWAQHILARSLHHASVFLLRTRLSTQELQERCETVITRLSKIEKESDDIIKVLDDKLHGSIVTITDKLTKYLKSDQAQSKMGSWQLQQLPSARSYDQWDDIEAQIDVAIEKRLCSIVSEWNTRGNHFQNAQNELQAMFKREFFMLENELENIDHLIQNESYPTTESIEEHANLHSFTDAFDPTGGAFDFNFSIFQKLALGLVAPVLLPIALGVFVGTPTNFMWDFKKWMKHANAKRNLYTYRQDPVSFVHSRAMHLAEKISEYDAIHEYVSAQMKPLKQHLSVMRDSIPKIIKLNRDLIVSLTEDKRSTAELESLYLGLEQDIPCLQEDVATFGNLHVQNHKYKKEQIDMVPEQTVFVNRKNTSGIWTEISKAYLKDSDQDSVQVVTIKTYKRKVQHFHLNREETNIRLSRHPYICRLVATFESERGVPGFILESHLNRARQELFGFKALPKSSEGRRALMKRCCHILEQVGIGLEYLHYKGLVHMELSLDTVMIIGNKEHVKLINIGEPRTADLPDPDSLAHDCVYLAPEVLQGAVYRPQADMYSLGLMAWELWNQDRVYKDERKRKLSDVIDQIRLGDNTLVLDPINPLMDLTQACLGEQGERISSTAWVDKIKDVICILNNDDGFKT